MSKITPTPEFLAAVLSRIPEGFIPETKLAKRLHLQTRRGKQAVNVALSDGKIARENGYFYDPTRLTSTQLDDLKSWCQPDLPNMKDDGTLFDSSIHERRALAQQRLADLNDPRCIAMVENVQKNGYLLYENLRHSAQDDVVLQKLLQNNILKRNNAIIFDPLFYSTGTIKEVERRLKLEPLREEIAAYLMTKPAQTASQSELAERFGEQKVREVIMAGGFSLFAIKLKRAPYVMQWVCTKGSDIDAARLVAEGSSQLKDEDWQEARQQCGEFIKNGAKDGPSLRAQVLARTYTLTSTAKRLGVHVETLEDALAMEHISAFFDPEETLRFSAEMVESIAEDAARRERIAEFEILKPRDIALVIGENESVIRRRLQKANVSRTDPTWNGIRGRWGLPPTLTEFNAILKTKKDEIRARRKAEHEDYLRKLREEQEREKQRREDLRQRLVAAFPTWRHGGRIEQQITLHIGQPNSGKTHDSLEALAAAESGWYLAPLRLLAFEIFDRFNQRGILCNLLTGEEHIFIPGAKITAATIEMFNPNQSGNCIIIDEAQMLADSDRGWAWTRALMEAQAPDIHVIGPPTVQILVEKLAAAAALPIQVVEHERLAPLRVAPKHWRLKEIPPSTILVAFSRSTVLQLKSDLEALGRNVSVVYGNLPPEVRRNQVERFATGETDICVATDAVGMGLNLPADNVCFYEIMKFDGKSTRLLTAAEIHQIGGRAGRYGFSESGLVGSVNKEDLHIIRQLYDTVPQTLTHAFVAPTAEDLEMLSGHLADRLQDWSALQSIPESLKGIIKTADLEERMSLANMLSDAEIEQLGIEMSLKLVNAPARQNNHLYWRACASAILGGHAMPLPPQPPQKIVTNIHLERTESAISCADIYLWLANRLEFQEFAPQEPTVRVQRTEWSLRIDEALVNRLDTRARCEKCNKVLPKGHRFSICDECYYNRYQNEYYH